MTDEVKQKIPVPVTVLTVSFTPLIPPDSHLSINTFCTNAPYDTRFPVCEQYCYMLKTLRHYCLHKSWTVWNNGIQADDKNPYHF